jgi:hypothetical protein
VIADAAVDGEAAVLSQQTTGLTGVMGVDNYVFDHEQPMSGMREKAPFRSDIDMCTGLPPAPQLLMK